VDFKDMFESTIMKWKKIVVTKNKGKPHEEWPNMQG
jgi:hypothetical protein